MIRPHTPVTPVGLARGRIRATRDPGRTSTCPASPTRSRPRTTPSSRPAGRGHRRRPGPPGAAASLGHPPVDASLGRVAGLALPALVVLAAEPLYVLVDTAVVGHLGRIPLAALAVGGVVLTTATWFGNVLAYGTTGRAARRFGAGSRAAAVAEGVQASWLALAVGLAILVAAQVFAGPVAGTLAGGHPDVARAAATWLRLAALGAPGLLLATAGNGWLRGVQELRRP